MTPEERDQMIERAMERLHTLREREEADAAKPKPARGWDSWESDPPPQSIVKSSWR